MQSFGIDWSIRNNIDVFDPDKRLRAKYACLEDLLAALDGPSKIVIESTFGSFDLAKRREFVAECARRGHTLVMVPPRMTAKRRKAQRVPKSDAVDARIIYELGETSAARRFKPPNSALVEKRKAAARCIMELRRRYITEEGQRMPDTGSSINYVSLKDVFARKLKAKLEANNKRWRYLPMSINHRALVNPEGNDYNPVTLAAVGVAAIFADNMREFESIAGLSANGYPSQIRADLYHFNWAGGNARKKLEKTGSFVEADGTKRPVFGGRTDGLKLTEWRRGFRWLYRQVKDVAKECYEETWAPVKRR